MGGLDRIGMPGALSAKNRISSALASKGFSLVEALIAIAIAAILAVALTRLASNTRMNAARVQELVDLMSLDEALLAQSAPRALGATHGRTGKFSWHIAVAPLKNFTATARQMSKEPADAAASSKNPELAAIGDQSGRTKKPELAEAAKWMPVYVTVAVGSPLGSRFSVDTIGIAPAPK